MKSILLIGLGRFGKHIAIHLNHLKHQVMAVDIVEERVDNVLPYVTNAQIGDSTNPDFMESLGVRNFDVCIVAIGNHFQNSLETTSLLKELGARLVVSRAARDVPSSSCATARMKSSTRKNSLPNGRPSATPLTMSLTISSSMKSTPCLKSRFRVIGQAGQSVRLIYEKNSTSISWASKKTESWSSPSLRISCWKPKKPCWCLDGAEICRNTSGYRSEAQETARRFDSADTGKRRGTYAGNGIACGPCRGIYLWIFSYEKTGLLYQQQFR